ncbi:hypothetical protein [Chryseobacterium paridis]|uniref:Uncharacterized protein n=1 Tax=Chryseobacterium paridis TaxID=2800328 RepID=A0ABS1FQ53_9FLAO|nr:hypothetical protein [Chryseobacterium paridis]MBK1894561.1 hypothetical protein [Chryseobacterium paridis]
MKKITNCFFVLFTLLINAQTKVAGTYHVDSGNPDDGGYNWMLLENHTFAMVTFGQIIAGTWSIDSNNIISFTPSTPKYPFDVYGRYDADQKGTKIMFDNFDRSSKAYMGNTEQGLQPILNEDANCFSYPMVKEFNNNFNDIVLSIKLFDQVKDVFYVAENKKYNNFIIMYYASTARQRPFTARLKEGRLYFRNDDRPSSPRKDVQPQELKEMGKFVANGLSGFSKESIISNKAYNIEAYGPGERSMEEDFDEESYLTYNYNYDRPKEIYTAKYPRGASEDDAYHDLDTMYKYNRIELKPNQNSYKKIEKSIFTITCKE